MSAGTEIVSAHPLLKELRNGLLWHCTSAAALRQIRADGWLRPIAGKRNRWGKRPYACQALGAVCLFDFSTESEARVLETASRWQQFLGANKPVTIVLGMHASKLPGRIVPYPENRDITPLKSSGPIPWVEVCQVGGIPISAVEVYLLICPVDYSRFRRCVQLDDPTLASTEREFVEVIRLAAETRANQSAKLQATMQSPEFKARLQLAKDLVRKMREQK